jgi:hypothetical protein
MSLVHLACPVQKLPYLRILAIFSPVVQHFDCGQLPGQGVLDKKRGQATFPGFNYQEK